MRYIDEQLNDDDDDERIPHNQLAEDLRLSSQNTPEEKKRRAADLKAKATAKRRYKKKQIIGDKKMNMIKQLNEYAEERAKAQEQSLVQRQGLAQSQALALETAEAARQLMPPPAQVTAVTAPSNTVRQKPARSAKPPPEPSIRKKKDENPRPQKASSDEPQTSTPDKRARAILSTRGTRRQPQTSTPDVQQSHDGLHITRSTRSERARTHEEKLQNTKKQAKLNLIRTADVVKALLATNKPANKVNEAALKYYHQELKSAEETAEERRLASEERQSQDDRRTEQKTNQNGNAQNRDRPFECLICGKRFKRAGHKRCHIQSQHTAMDKFKCSICKHTAAQRGEINQHITSHRYPYTDEVKNIDLEDAPNYCLLYTSPSPRDTQ